MEFAEFIQVPKIDRAVMKRPYHQPLEGTICLTGHHLMMLGPEGDREMLLLHSNIDCVEKRLQGSGGSVLVHCKNLMHFQLDIRDGDDCMKLTASLHKLANIENVSLKYPFVYHPTFDVMEDGWVAFAPEAEFNRLIANCLNDWRISHVNKGFKLCRSYPEAVVVPRAVDDETLAQSARFRQGGRFPVLCYYHSDNQTVLMRSSQPLVGEKGRRCKEDEKLINATLYASGRKGFIVDTRSQALAKALLSKGGGTEPEAHYPQWKRSHRSIDRVSGLHESFSKLVKACCDVSVTSERWLSRLEACGWLSNVKDVLTCACSVAQCMDRDNASVLVHGSEGTDTTLMVTSITQLILDPDCRTLRGFEALIDREWVQAGHPFQERCRKSAFAVTSQAQEAPSFLLFLDATWQVWQQFPCSFEFSEKFLIFLFENSYSSDFGTFLCNNQQERSDLDLARKTVSIWSFVNRPEVMEEYLNPLYEPNPNIIWPSVAPQSLQLWEGLYLRWVLDQRFLIEAESAMKEIKSREKEIRTQVGKLRRVLVDLEKEAMEANLIPTHPRTAKAPIKEENASTPE